MASNVSVCLRTGCLLHTCQVCCYLLPGLLWAFSFLTLSLNLRLARSRCNTFLENFVFWPPVAVWSPNADTITPRYRMAFRLWLWWLRDTNELIFRFGPIPVISHYAKAKVTKSETNVKSKTLPDPDISDEGYSASDSLLPDLRHIIASLFPVWCQWGGALI